MEGAASGRKHALEADFEENDALLYAAMRNILLRKGKNVEIVAITNRAGGVMIKSSISVLEEKRKAKENGKKYPTAGIIFQEKK